MTTALCLELDELLAPIAGELPAGDGRAYAHRLREQLQELRREDDPTAFTDATRPAVWKHADWEGVLELAQRALREESKDLRVACHMAEALVRLQGLAGLRQSLQLLRQMSDQCWERLNPPLDDDPDTRAAPLANMLDDPARGLCFPNLIRELPLIGAGEEAFSFSDWKRIRGSGDSAALAEVNRALRQCDPRELQAAFDETVACRDELAALRSVLDQKLGTHAPGFVHLEESLNDCHRLLGLALQEVGPAGAVAQSPDPAAAPAAEDTTAGSGSPANLIQSRQAAYQQIEQAANLLCRLEPHSPVPYLVKRAVGLGKLPFPQLIRQLVREENILSEMYRELGIEASSGNVEVP